MMKEIIFSILTASVRISVAPPIGILIFSGMFLVGQESWTPVEECPTGTYFESMGNARFDLTTLEGSVMGYIPSISCGGEYSISGTSDGETVEFRTELNIPNLNCCSPVDFTFTSIGSNCNTLTGTMSHPPESNCFGYNPSPYALIKEGTMPF